MIDPGTVVEADWSDEYRKGYHHGIGSGFRDGFQSGFEDAIRLASEKVGRLAKVADVLDENVGEQLRSIANSISVMKPLPH